MRSPQIVLENLQRQSKKQDYRFERLYRNLYNSDFYLLAYQNLYANKGAMTPGVDGTTLDGTGMERIESLIQSLKDLTGNRPWERVMLKMRRKTLIVCDECHRAMHSVDHE
jgi:hypothetical protein